ncbi:hypothetical protein LG307_14860 [Sutcliffiella horikoshii]|uniref:hypothetical protein n=1 Tax=Sutcliffiella horikoshii TaxID=79883 RepID=UPI00384FF0ED
MITLKNIGLDENEEKVIVDFTYEGNHMDFKGKLKMTPHEYLASREYGDLAMMEGIIQTELEEWLES